ncbi:hypothetical protein H0H93_007627 [Arthromyces matolae]|nr:hypothetical protein H0H93_007627 [Arthromyces matolae]
MDVILRVYLIPYDLSNSGGKLRRRKKEILSQASRLLKKMLPKIIQDESSWRLGTPSPSLPRLIPNVKDRRTLGEIYGDLRSPSPSVTIGHDITTRLLDLSDDLDGLGMRSRLYHYQRRSVAAMLQRELDPSDIPDPLYVALQTVTGESFYLQPGTMEILREQPITTPGRSGILCEELGTGKTVMILALVLATIQHISTPEPHHMHHRPILTPLSFRHFPSPECMAAREPFLRNKKFRPEGAKVPSLVELLIHHRRTNPDTKVHDTATAIGAARDAARLHWEAKVEDIPQANLLKLNVPFYHHYPDDPDYFERSPRKNAETGPRVIYLTSATLIIVPANLLSQWDREIHKHCEYPLRVLTLRSGTPMPKATSLATDYDIILMTYKRFTAENKFNKISKLHSFNACCCPSIPGSRIPDCKCKSVNVSPLLQVRWKRLVIDEGHVSASLSTILTPFVKSLSVEKRWIVTGTPTTNLLGLSLGENSSQQVTDTDQVTSELETEDMDLDEPLSGPSSRSETPAFSNIDNALPRIWTKHDREDLGKLGKMVSHFIAVPQFSASPRLMTTHVIDPLLDSNGPQPGAIQVLNQIMQSIMIRHRIEDVEKEVVLPPLRQEAVLLDLDPIAAKSYNVIQAALAINAVDSQRVDQDYMFHPRNADALQATIQNMSQVMFWSSDEALYGVDDMMKHADAFVQTAKKRNASPEDIALLEEANRYVKIAGEDHVWRAIQSHEDVPYRVAGLPQSLFNAWTRVRLPESSEPSIGFVHCDRLLKMQETVLRRPLISEEGFISRGAETASEDIRLRQLYIESLKGKERKSASKVVPHQEVINAGLKAEDAAKKARNPETIKEMKKDLDIAISHIDEGTPMSPSRHSSLPVANYKLARSSLLGLARIQSTASNKLNYIINEVLKYSAEEKFLIFSDSLLTLAHVSEALELMHIKFLRFTTQISTRHREEMVLTFETSEKYRVFLMELKHSARGLNIISASRVIFCEPVWQADVESQAIKRAHRIGQTRSIVVKTLAIRGTAEETMVSRRNLIKENHEKMPKLIEESGMRHFIAVSCQRNPTSTDLTSKPESKVYQFST